MAMHAAEWRRLMTGERAPSMHDDISEILVSEEELQAGVARLAAEITRDYANKRVLLLGILKGAAMFLIDLMKQIDLPLEIDFMAISSYGASTHSSGVVRILKDLDQGVEDKHVLVVEDIVDTGLTLQYIMDNLRRRSPLSLKVCALLDKERPHDLDIPLDYVGFHIPDRFVVGYGLDYAEIYRNLRYIGVLRREVYAGK